MSRKPGLGRGLSALLEDVRSPDAAVQMLDIATIVANDRQPRRSFDASQLRELSESIAAMGVLQPILVRPIDDGKHEIVAGERRWRAAQAAGLHQMPVVIRELDEGGALEIAIVENVQRSDLNAIEEAYGYRRLIDEFGHTQDAIGKIVGKSRSHVANLLRLLDLAEPVRDALMSGAITMGHARAMLSAADPVRLMREVIGQGLSVRETEARVTRETERQASPRKGPRAVERDADLVALENRVGQALGLHVDIEAQDGAGQLTVVFGSLDELDLVCRRLSGGRV